MSKNIRKILQKQAYDIVSHRYGLLILIGTIALVAVSAFHFGEAMLEWSHEKYAAVFNSLSDNIGGKSYRERLCLPVPIDVVYTWVNGSDPNLINQLRSVKLDMEEELNTTREEKCTFTNCLVTTMVILDPPLPHHMTLKDLAEVNPVFGHAQRMFPVTSYTGDKWNFTVVVFPEGHNMKAVLNETLIVNLLNVTLRKGYITTDWTVPNSILMSDYIIMAGLPHTYTLEKLKEKLPDKMKTGIEKMEIYSEEGLAVFYVPEKANFNKILEISNFTIDGKEPTLNAANLVWDLRDFRKNDDISASRFEDNEELRYSLRSIDKFAPWVRNIFIITNGQIPYWLNMEHPRIFLVTHEDIFINKSHLPTFSSPAIEAHVHRIPGLSKRFIYMNDDVMFGKDVWPDDFFSHSGGQKVYLTWPVPNCQDGCPSSWIRDGYCDKACNNSECEWDGGDCSGAAAHQQSYWHGAGFGDDHGAEYCSKGCPNTWLSDRYCDATEQLLHVWRSVLLMAALHWLWFTNTCNVKDCGFDTADCGVSKFQELYGLDLTFEQKEYRIPHGITVAYFNLTRLITTNGSVESASYNMSSIVRTASVGNKFKVMTMVLYPDKNLATIAFTLKGHRGNSSKKFEFLFSVSANTQALKGYRLSNVTKVNKTLDAAVLTNETQASNTTEEDVLIIEEIPRELWFPKADITTRQLEPLPASLNLTADMLPEPLAKELNESIKQFHDGELTLKGFQIQERIIWQKYKIFQQHEKQISRKKHPLFPHGNRRLLGLAGSSIVVEMPQNGHLIEFNTENLDEKNDKESSVNVDGVAKFEVLPQRSRSEKEELLYAIINPDEGRTEHQFPWEKEGTFSKLIKEKEKLEYTRQLTLSKVYSRRLLDTFGDSLRHVNKLFNKAFGYTARKVPAHMPHMIDKDIMTELQEMFPEEWEETSSHKIRSSNDMQFAFAYFYFMMGVTRNVTIEEVFDEIDTDKSGVLSDREIRTLATRLYELPLSLQMLTSLEGKFKNCSNFQSNSSQEEVPISHKETYYEKDMPQVTRSLFVHCDDIKAMVHQNFKPVRKYHHSEMEETEVAFKMIKSNISIVVGQLDDIRKHPKKFICLNDNIEHSKEDAKTVKAILQDFYEAFFPEESQFELQREYRNRFLHIDELREWRRYRDWLKFWTHLALALLVIFTVASFFADKIEAAQRKWFRRRPRYQGVTSSSKSSKDKSDNSVSVQSSGLIQTV